MTTSQDLDTYRYDIIFPVFLSRQLTLGDAQELIEKLDDAMLTVFDSISADISATAQDTVINGAMAVLNPSAYLVKPASDSTPPPPAARPFDSEFGWSEDEQQYVCRMCGRMTPSLGGARLHRARLHPESRKGFISEKPKPKTKGRSKHSKVAERLAAMAAEVRANEEAEAAPPAPADEPQPAVDGAVVAL